MDPDPPIFSSQDSVAPVGRSPAPPPPTQREWSLPRQFAVMVAVLLGVGIAFVVVSMVLR
jgi:hypothetical protein